LLHVATDWPGHFPHVSASIAALVEAGADVNARFHGPHEETPLHWAASSADVAALDALLDAEIAPQVRALCEKYGLPYTSGPLATQYLSTWRWILRMALPGGAARNRRPRPSRSAPDYRRRPEQRDRVYAPRLPAAVMASPAVQIATARRARSLARNCPGIGDRNGMP